MAREVNSNIAAPTHHRAVVPFYAYAALCILASSLLIFFSAEELTGHHFQPKIIALAHLMALGWATMVILGASHQLIPVLVETELFSEKIASATFWCAAVGIPILVYGFATFDLSILVVTGGILINFSIISYVINLFCSFIKKPKTDVHAMFILTASLWLLLTTLLGLLLAINFTRPMLSRDSLHFLTLHAHIGILGWFLLLVTGVASKLIPMFLISKYEDKKMLYVIFGAINLGLLIFILLFLLGNGNAYALPALLIASAIFLFIYYCYRCFKERLRKRVDKPVKLSLVSVLATVLPLILFYFINNGSAIMLNKGIANAYGAIIFFGWLTALIFGMTFKTLPFIIWNKLRLRNPTSGNLNDPRQLYSERDFKILMWTYVAGVILLAVAILFALPNFIKISAVLLVFASLFFNINIWRMITRKKL